MSDCVFCQIVAGKLPSKTVYEDRNIIVFEDLHPKAQIHLLIVPRTHIDSLSALSAEHGTLVADMLLLLPRLARENKCETGFRTVINTGPGGGQEVAHLHFHLLGGPTLPAFK